MKIEGTFENIVDLKSVEFDKVADLVRKGYTVYQVYAKNAIMMKKKGK